MKKQHNRKANSLFFIASCLVFVVFPFLSFASSSYDKVLSELRKEIQILDLDIQTQKDLKRELELSHQSEELVVQSKIRKLQSEISSLKVKNESLKKGLDLTSLDSIDQKQLKQSLEMIHTKMKKSLPLRLETREKKLKEIIDSLDGTNLSMDHVVSTLDFIEDEQVFNEGLVALEEDLQIDSQTYKCKVVSAGFSLFFYKCGSDQSGYAYLKNQIWNYSQSKNKELLSFINSQFSPSSQEFFQVPLLLKGLSS